MRKGFTFVLSTLLTFTLVLFALPQKTEAATYPGTNINVSAGDLLYSSKGWETGFVGHVAIVGDDGKIYHSTPANDVPSGATGESLSSYLSRFPSGSQIRVYRYQPTGQTGPFLQGINAGKWARQNYSKVQQYTIAGGYKLGDVTKNYCSKFVWQAYKLGANVSIDTPYLNNYLTTNSTTLIAPSELNLSQGSNGSIFLFVATITK